MSTKHTKIIPGLACACVIGLSSLRAENQWIYDPSPMFPYGQANPAQSDPEARIFDRFIGVNNCTQKRIDYKSREVTESDGRWVWYYDANGYGVRDLYRFNVGAPVSQRIYNAQTKQWHIWYFLGHNFYYAGEWVGGAVDDGLVFENPNGELAGRKVTSRTEFYNISSSGYSWRSVNVDGQTGEEFVDWEVSCRRAR